MSNKVIGKKKKKPARNLVKKAKKGWVQPGSEIAIRLTTGIETTFIINASQRLISSRSKESEN